MFSSCLLYVLVASFPKETNWLVVSNIFIFPYIGNSNPNWLSYFSEGLKPPTSQILRALWESCGLKPQISVGSHWILVSWKVGWFWQNHMLGFSMVYSYIHELSFLMCLSVYPIEAHDNHTIRYDYIPPFFNSRGSRTPVLDQFRGASRIVRVCQWAIGLVEGQFCREFLTVVLAISTISFSC